MVGNKIAKRSVFVSDFVSGGSRVENYIKKKTVFEAKRQRYKLNHKDWPLIGFR